MDKANEIVLFETKDKDIKLPVPIDKDTVRARLRRLQRSRKVKHIKAPTLPSAVAGSGIRRQKWRQTKNIWILY